MQASVFLMESKVDRLLVSCGLVLALVSAGLLFFSSSDSGLIVGVEPIGTLTTAQGVQRRHSRALSWSTISGSGKLYPKDMVYTPPQSSAEVQLNTSQKLILAPESMVEFDSVTSGTFNVVLVQGAAKIQTGKGEELKELVKEEESASVAPTLKRPSLPLFFVDIPAWGKRQGELFDAVGQVGQNSKILAEDRTTQTSLELRSLTDYALSVGPAIVKPGDHEKQWQVLRWSDIPLGGVTYEVEISREEEFKRVIKQDLIKGRLLEVQLLDPGKYFWRVRAKLAKNQIQSDVGVIQVDNKR